MKRKVIIPEHLRAYLEWMTQELKNTKLTVDLIPSPVGNNPGDMIRVVRQKIRLGIAIFLRSTRATVAVSAMRGIPIRNWVGNKSFEF